MQVYQQICDAKQKGLKQLAVLVDPDKTGNKEAESVARMAEDHGVDFVFVGGSLLSDGNLSNCIRRIRYACSKPIVIFPGSVNQVDDQADAILFLSLISGRNPELLIGTHVVAAPLIREKKLEPISTGYMLIESGSNTTALYMSNTHPIPHNKPSIAACTAMAGEMLGMKTIFLDAGSGATKPISEEMIAAVSTSISIPLMVGGGIRTPEKAALNCQAGADLIVVGTSIERDASLLGEFASAVKSVVARKH
ncbi:MAG: geranylgeranylglyceryl/heptaprenylglyceryl phosphate synthase [Bacteroidota bacterium]|jgi:phosphoglycerol geranylgeranyltransferase